MSSSDYIQYKKSGVILKNLAKEPYVLDASEYTFLMDYNLENTVTNSKLIYNKLNIPNHQMVFNMDRVVTNCPTFPLCKNTHARVNRKKLISAQIAPRPKPKYIKDRMNFSDKYKTLCITQGKNRTKCNACRNALCCGCKPNVTAVSQGCKSFTF